MMDRTGRSGSRRGRRIPGLPGFSRLVPLPLASLPAVVALGALLPLLALPARAAAGTPPEAGPSPAPATAPVHEEAVLESPASAVPAGTSLTLDGRDFTAGEAYTLRLQGALREYDLREVEPAEDGTFSLELEIPSEVRPGSYQVVALAPDGDVVARLDLAVLRGASGAAAPSGAEGAGDDASSGGGGAAGPSGADAARSDERPIERRRTGLEWGIIGLLVGLAGGVGIGLLRKGNRHI